MGDINRRSMFGITAAIVAGANGFAKPVEPSRLNGWPCWRGPQRDGSYSEPSWPSSLDSLTKEWSVELADSYSGPIVAGQAVYTTETVGKRDETLRAFNVSDGQELWQKEWPGAMSVPFFAKANGDWIRSTPATNGDLVVVAGMRDVVAAFDCQTGEERWRQDFVEDHGAKLPPFGLVCSPLIDGDAIYIQAGGWVRKIGLADGRMIWKSLKDDAGMSGGAFSSPIIATIQGQRQLVVQTRTELCGVSLDDGAVLWKQPIASFRGMNILTPTVWQDHVFTSSYGGRSQLLRIKRNDNSAGGGSGWEVEQVWDGKAEAYMSSPIVLDGYLYMHLKNQRFSCINLSDGMEAWRTTPFGKYWSMVSNGQQILALDERGELLHIEATPEEFRLLGRRQVSDEPSWAHLAIAQERIFVRRQHGLDVFRF